MLYPVFCDPSVVHTDKTNTVPQKKQVMREGRTANICFESRKPTSGSRVFGAIYFVRTISYLAFSF